MIYFLNIFLWISEWKGEGADRLHLPLCLGRGLSARPGSFLPVRGEECVERGKQTHGLHGPRSQAGTRRAEGCGGRVPSLGLLASLHLGQSLRDCQTGPHGHRHLEEQGCLVKRSPFAHFRPTEPSGSSASEGGGALMIPGGPQRLALFSFF